MFYKGVHSSTVYIFSHFYIVRISCLSPCLLSLLICTVRILFGYIQRFFLLLIRVVPGGSMSQVVGLPNNSYKPITNTAYKNACTRLPAASDKVYQLLAHGRWFSPGTPASSIAKTVRHNIAEILLKVALNTINQIKSTNKSTIYDHGDSVDRLTKF